MTFLVCLGLVMVYSVTSARAVIVGGDPISQVRRQLTYAILGVCLFGLVTRVRTDVFRRLAPAAVGVSALLLMMVLVPGVGVVVNGARRWLALGPIQIQPSELAKVALVLWIAMMVARNQKRLKEPGGMTPYLLLTGFLGLLIVIEPDLGTTGALVMTAFAMLFVAGAPMRKLGMIAGGAGALAIVMIASFPYQRARVDAFLNPWSDPTGNGFQIVQSQIAIGSGGLFGRGLGNSIQKNFYLPEAQTDMIGAIIGEELGLLGLFALIAAFVVIAVAGFRIALKAGDLHRRVLATGITALICIQAVVNLGQVFGALPVTGVPLPFVSAGGTSLVVFLGSVGILVNISRGGSAVAAKRSRPASSTRDHRGGGDGRSRQAGPRDRRRIAS